MKAWTGCRFSRDGPCSGHSALAPRPMLSLAKGPITPSNSVPVH